MFVVTPQSRYHPYSGSYASTLSNRRYGRSMLSKPLANPLGVVKGVETPMKSEWDWKEIKLNSGQADAYTMLVDLVESEKPFHVFLAGPAGTGKTVVLKKFTTFTRCHYGFKEACVVGGPTGLSAENAGGVTIHSLLHFFPGQNPFVMLTPETANYLYQQLRRLKVLIIDEISMVAALLLARIDHRLQEIFNCTAPFGGISVVVVGDLLQLPPVPSDTDEANKNTAGRPSEFLFSSIPAAYVAARNTATPTSPKCLWDLFSVLELKKNVRAKDRREAAVLERIRLGEDTPAIRGYLHHNCRMEGAGPKDLFRELRSMENEEPGKSFMILARTNAEVDEINRWKFENSSTAQSLAPIVASPFNQCKYPLKSNKMKEVKVVVGGKVMITNNLKTENLPNGTLCKLLKITNEHLELKRLDNGLVTYLSRKLFSNGKQFWFQYPVAMAEAITVYKSQGLTFDAVVVATGQMFKSSFGCFYTAISRARSMKSSRIANVESVRWGVCPWSLGALERIRQRTSTD